MTDYCSLADALSLLPSIGTLRDAVAAVDADPDATPPVGAVVAVTATIPSATQAATILASVTAEIDMHLRAQNYTLPVTGPDALASLQTICMNGTAARIAKAKWPTATGAGGDGGVIPDLRADYMAGLAFIDKGGIGPDVSTPIGSLVSHGFRDSAGAALADSTRVIRTDNETRF